MATNHLTPSQEKSMEDERDNLRATGDLMQSSLSRVLEFVHQEFPSHRWDALPYEVGMAVLEGESSVNLWTEIRSKA